MEHMRAFPVREFVTVQKRTVRPISTRKRRRLNGRTAERDAHRDENALRNCSNTIAQSVEHELSRSNAERES